MLHNSSDVLSCTVVTRIKMPVWHMSHTNTQSHTQRYTRPLLPLRGQEQRCEKEEEVTFLLFI